MRREIKIKQYDKQDCGAACITSICAYHGLKLPLNTVRDACGTAKDGTSMKGLLDASQKLGLSAKVFKSPERNSTDLLNVEKPLILHMKNEHDWLHFVVLYEITEQKAVIMDPADGEIHKINIPELEKEWTGYLAIMSPSSNFEKADKSTNPFLRLKDLFISNRHELIPALIGSIIYVISGLSISLFLQQIIDRVIPEKDFSLLMFFAALMIILMSLSLIIGHASTMLIIRASIKIDAQLVMSYIRKLFLLPVSFFSTRSTGELNSRISDAYRIRSFLSNRMIIIFISIISLLVSFALLFTFYWKLAVLTIAFIPFYYILYQISNKINKKVNKKTIESAAKFEEINIETLSMIKSIKYFGAKELFSRKVEQYYCALAQMLYKGGRNVSLFSTCSEGITKALTLVIIIIGSLFVFDSSLSIGELVSFYSIASFFSSPIMTLVESSSEITEAEIATKRLFEIMDTEEDGIAEYFETEIGSDLNLVVENIDFCYPGRMELFKNLSFTIKSGQINTLVGKNGCGKSTLASLLMRVYTPTKGKIKIGNIDIQHLNIEQWRNYISIVPQTVDIFNGSILENITLSSEHKDIEKVFDICKKVGLLETFENMPNGILAKAGENGSYLSGGERQKIGLARALYREPKILILDEATSSLDINLKNNIYQLIRKISNDGITVIIISHEQDCLKIADNAINI